VASPVSLASFGPNIHTAAADIDEYCGILHRAQLFPPNEALRRLDARQTVHHHVALRQKIPQAGLVARLEPCFGQGAARVAGVRDGVAAEGFAGAFAGAGEDAGAEGGGFARGLATDMTVAWSSLGHPSATGLETDR
jgi:hypothetical protein